MHQRTDLRTVSFRWGIYHQEREYAREVGDPRLGVVMARTKTEADMRFHRRFCHDLRGWTSAPCLFISRLGREPFRPIPTTGRSIRDRLFLQQEGRSGWHPRRRIEHRADFAADERPHLWPGNAMHPRGIDALGNGEAP